MTPFASVAGAGKAHVHYIGACWPPAAWTPAELELLREWRDERRRQRELVDAACNLATTVANVHAVGRVIDAAVGAGLVDETDADLLHERWAGDPLGARTALLP
jgi:hypothetical protein